MKCHTVNISAEEPRQLVLEYIQFVWKTRSSYILVHCIIQQLVEHQVPIFEFGVQYVALNVAQRHAATALKKTL